MSRRRPKRITPGYLERAALFYLDRYSSSSANLKRVLMRKVDRGIREHGGDRDEAEGWVDALVQRLLGAGVLDDERYARQRAGSLQRRGHSRRLIAAKLRAAGLPRELVDRALAALREEAADPELAAAVTWARRRHLGPFRRDLGTRTEQRQRDLAVLARRGFSYGVASRVIDADSPEALEALLGD